MVGSEGRPRVAILGTRGYPSYYGGFETAVRKLAPYLVDSGWDVTVYGRPGGSVEDDPLRDERIDAVEVSGITSRSLSTLSSGYFASRAARRTRPDVALVMNVANGFFLRSLRHAGVPTVVNVDGMEWEREKWGRVARRVFLAGARSTARHADQIICDSMEIKRRWREEFNRDGVFIPYGAEFGRDSPTSPGFDPGSYALVVARFVPENSIDAIFAAVPQLAGSLDVVLVGSSGYGGDYDAKARDLDERHPRVHWVGHLRDDARLHALWRDAGVYIHGHSVGGTNPALVQAMACGSPTVARDTPYNREVLPSSAVYFEPTPQSVVRAVERVIGDDRVAQQMRTENLARAKEAYTWDSVCAAYNDVLRAALG